MFRRQCLPLAIVLLTISPVFGQGQAENKGNKFSPLPRTRLAGYPPSKMLAMPVVRKDLNLNPGQANRLKELEKKEDDVIRRHNEQFTRLMKELGDMPDLEQVAALRQRRSSALREMINGFDDEQMKVLDKSQRERLVQLRFQLEGPVAFLNPDVQKKLNLSPEQIEMCVEIYNMGKTNMGQLKGLTQDAIVGNSQQRATKADQQESGVGQNTNSAIKIDPKLRDELNGRLKDLAKQTDDARSVMMKQIESILTKKQRQSYIKLCGKPIDGQK